MTREEAAFNEGLAVGLQINYVKGDLFREDFDYPINPYVQNQALRQRFQHGLTSALGNAFRSDLVIWIRIENELLAMHKLRTPADIRREARNLTKNGLLVNVVNRQRCTDPLTSPKA